MQKRLLTIGLTMTLVAGLATASFAKVSAEEAERLGKDLTPFGAEMAGNADGTIPAWDGGITGTPEGVNYKKGDFMVDIFADDKKVVSITAANVAEHADKLSEGMKQLFKKYPETFRMDVYPTRRTHGAVQWVADGTKANATRATIREDRVGMQDAFNGIPFPIPQSGEELIFNHLTRWKGEAAWGTAMGGTVSASGRYAVSGGGFTYEKYPLYRQGAKSVDEFTGDLWWIFQRTDTPARRKGELLLVKDHVNAYENPRKAWQYLPGQRRVRRAPTIAYDTPAPNASGLVTYDDAYLFNGSIDRFDWKIVGKQEMYIPYNSYKTTLATKEELLTGKHPNPDLIRWELHRVWVLESTLKDGKRHIYGKRTFFLDEDTWTIGVVDKYDTKGNLWRTAFMNQYSFHEQGLVRDLERFSFDFQGDVYAFESLFNELDEFIVYNPVADKQFTPEALRRKGRR